MRSKAILALGGFKIEAYNLFLNQGADALASLVSGRQEYAPTHIGLIYGETDTPGSELEDPVADKTQKWADLVQELAAVGGNVMLCPILGGSTVSTDSELYAGNKSRVYASSATGVEALPTSSPYAGAFGPGVWLWHTVLIARIRSIRGYDNLMLARASMKSGGNYYQQPSGFSAVQHWELPFTA